MSDRHLHPVPDNTSTDVVPADQPLEGDILSDEESAELDRRMRGMPAVRAYTERITVDAYERVRRSPYPPRAGKALVRHALYVAHGAGVVWQRRRDARSNTLPLRMARTAEAAGDHERAQEWWDRSEAAVAAKHQRRMGWLDAPKKLAVALATVLASLAGVLLVTGGLLAYTQRDVSAVVDPFVLVANTVASVVVVLTVAWVPISLACTAVGVLYLWGQGKRRSEWEPPAWLAAPRDGDAPPGEVVNLTPSHVARALRDLGIPQLRKAVAADSDNGGWMVGAIVRYGPGWQVAITLPPQVNWHKVADRRDTLAGNLDRKAHEVHIEASEDSEREFTLWVADSGALDRNVPPSPLMDDDFGQVDIYRDMMPWGISLKGEQVLLNLLQQHFLLAGLSKQGKTAAARALVLWAALDPTVKFRIADLKGFGDWSMFEAIAEILIEGAGDTNFIATADMLIATEAEMYTRYERWRAMGRKGDIDRASSQLGSGFEPIFVVIDEVQKLYMCSTVYPDGGAIGGDGKRSIAARAVQALHDQGRAVNIHVHQFAQNPTNRNLPVVVREGAMIRASLCVGTESVGKMALGEAPVETGAAPHALRPGKDRGTVVLAPGESMDLPGGGTHTTVRTHFISTEDSYTIIDRAKAFRAAANASPALVRDLLADVADVLADQRRVKTTDVAARLRKLDTRYEPYQGLNGKVLTQLLTEAGVRITELDGTEMVYAERVHAARAHAAEDEGE